MHRSLLSSVALFAALALLALPCDAGRKDEPDVVVVQHVLISYKGRIPGKQIDRSKREAKALAEEILERAEAGEDFNELMREYTDDRGAGVYKLVNKGLPKPADGYQRDEMAPSFGDVAFELEVGQVGMAKYHAGLSPYGWHIIKRLE